MKRTLAQKTLMYQKLYAGYKAGLPIELLVRIDYITVILSAVAGMVWHFNGLSLRNRPGEWVDCGQQQSYDHCLNLQAADNLHPCRKEPA